MKSPLLAAAPLTALIVGAASLALGAPAAASADGATIYKQRCAVCHSGAAGPKLDGVYNRKAGAADFRYSPALAKSGIVWNAKELDAYLAAPAARVPGTRMAVGLRDAAQRKAVIDYLKRQ